MTAHAPGCHSVECSTLLTVRAVAAMLQISRSKVYELIARKDLPSVKIDGSRRIRLADLRAFVDALGSGSRCGEQG